MNLATRLKALTASLTAKGVAVSEETVKSAVLDIEDAWEPGGSEPITREEMKTGPARAAHGADAERQIRMSSDLQAQGQLQSQYEAIASTLGAMGQTMKGLTDAVAALQAAQKPVANAENAYLPLVEKALKDAKSAIFKAETDDEDEDDSVEKAERLLTKAVKLLKKAEDEEEDEDRVEKARSTVKAVKKSIEAIKAEKAAAAVTKAEDEKDEKDEDKEAAEKAKAEAAATAKSEPDAVQTAVKSLEEKLGIVTKSVTEVMELVANSSRANPVPPQFPVAKAETQTETVAEPNYAVAAMELGDSGRFTRDQVLSARRIASHLTMAKADPGLKTGVIAEIRAADEPVRELFKSALAA